MSSNRERNSGKGDNCDLISGLGSGGLGVFDFDTRDAVAVHLFDGEAAASVIAGVADGGNLLQL